MRPTPTPSRTFPLLAQAALVFACCGAAGYLLAPADEERVKAEQVTAATATASLSAGETPLSAAKLSMKEEIQHMLAQGGCPGWIALASEPGLPVDKSHDAKAIHDAAIHDAHVQPTAGSDLVPPRVTYPRRLAVPSHAPGPFDPNELRLVQLPPVGDELISEKEDLLFSSPEIAPKQPEAKSPGPPEPGEAPAAAAASSSAPAVTPAPAPRTTPRSAKEMLEDRGDLLSPGSTPLVRPAQPSVPPPAHTAPMHGAPAATPPVNAAPPTTPPADSKVDPKKTAAADKRPAGEQSRCVFEAESQYPSAKTCRTCHEKIYEEWSVSSHAYAAVSPMFHKFEQKINNLTQGTIGYFCYRCHSPAGTSLGISRAAPMFDLPPVAREGVTCVACHRVREMYGKTNGERRIEPGDVYAPVYGSIGGDGVAQVIAEKEKYKVKTSPDEKGPGQPMHSAGFTFPQLSRSEFCTSCHQVAVYPGIKLEVVWEQYRASPACKKGVSCQDCHMGRIPGVPSGYEYGAAAEINKKSVNTDRKHSNHVFYGPGYSIAHPGVFPFNPKADRWSMRDWLLFDWRAGWGTDAFEDAVDDGDIKVNFPEVWKEADDRYDARDIIDDNLKKKKLKDQLRAQVMENGSHVDGPFFTAPRRRGQDLEFNYIVTNTNDGHNLPTASLGAQPQLWANVALINPRGERVWESGYLDSFGDLADIHSEDVRHKRIPYDWQLFNLQTMFLITGAKGTDREFFLPINIDIDPLPFIRPAAQPVSVINHPPFIRMEARSLAPLGSRTVPYKIPGKLLCEPGRYRLAFRMRNRTEPMYFMRFCDSTVEMQRAMMEGTLDFHQSSVEFDVE